MVSSCAEDEQVENTMKQNCEQNCESAKAGSANLDVSPLTALTAKF